MFLSHEGLSNHFYDFSDVALKNFRHFLLCVPLHIFMVVRDAESWVKSYYKQALINPPIAAYNYATELRLNDFRRLPRTQSLLHVEHLEENIRKAYGADNVVVTRYESGWLSNLLNILNVEISAEFSPLRNANTSVPDDVAELIRQVNLLFLEPPEREAFLHCCSVC